MKKALFTSFCLTLALLSFSQTVTIGTGTTTTQYNPLYSWYGYNYTQQIYTAAEISAGGVSSGDQITEIRFYWAGSGNLTNADSWVVYLGNTAQANFGTTTDWIPLASMTQVYNGNVTLPGAAGWMTITLSTPYTWTGNNLVVAIDENIPNYGTTAYWNYTSTSTNYRAMYYYSDATNPDPAAPPAGTRTYNRPNIQLVFTSAIPMTYLSSTTTQTNTSSVTPGSTNQHIIGIEVVTNGGISPLTAGNFSFNTTGTTNPGTDIQNARLWFTGTNSTFATTTQVGGTIANPNGAFVINAAQTLNPGTNYFWLTYDIRAGATIGNMADAVCNSVVVSVARTPAITNPGPGRPISNMYLMNNTNVTTCSGTFYDSGGPTGDYGFNENFTKTFTPSTPGTMMRVTFSAFNVESGYDYLYVYNGPTTGSPQVAGSPFSGSTLPAVITSTAAGGELTFRFTSDGVINYSGWAATLSCFTPGPMTYVSSAVTQNNTTTVCPDRANNEIIGIQVVTDGTLSPINVTSFTFRTDGTTNVADIANAKVFYTGTNSSFSATNQFGSTYATPPAAGINMIITGTQALQSGTNYFWLTYDVVAGATVGNSIDGRCNSVTVAGTPRTPSPQTVAGVRQISATGCPPPNDDCVNATPLVPPNTYFESNYYADLWGPFPDDPTTTQFNCNGSIDNIIFYTLTTGSVGGDITIYFSNIVCKNGDGVQAALFQTSTPCGSGAAWGNAISCESPWSTMDFSILLPGLLPNTTYYFLVDGWAGDECTWEMYVEGNLVVPIELSHFTSQCYNGKTILHWLTASEINNHYFTIERSVNGLNFEPIGTINGAGSSNEPKFYTFEDSQQSYTTYYRLLQTDFDGTTKVSATLSSTCDSDIEYKLTIGDNTESGYIDIFHTAMINTSYLLTIIDSKGKLVYSKQYIAGDNLIQQKVATSSFASGIYLVNVSSSVNNHSQKMMIR